MIRAFLAVELPESLRTQVSQVQRRLKQRLEWDLPRSVRLSWVRPPSIHLTVKFLGDIPEDLVEPLRRAMTQAIGSHRALQIPLDRLGVFPRPQQPRVLWVGPSEIWERGEAAARLTAWHRTVEKASVSLGLAPDQRALSPHLTIARIKAGEAEFGKCLARSGETEQPLALGALSVDSIVLMKSELNPRGSIYTTLWTVRLES